MNFIVKPALNRPALRGLLVAIAALFAVGCAKETARSMGSIEQAGAHPGGRLLARTAWIAVEVDSMAVAIEKATAIATHVGGHVEGSEVRREAPARLHLRVPAASLDSVLVALSGLGDERRRSVASRDVTENVRDSEAELANLRALRDRLRELLQRAKEVKEVLAVEAELTRIQTRVDTLESALKATRRDIELSAVELELEEKRPKRILGPLGLVLEGTRWIIEKLFVIRS